MLKWFLKTATTAKGFAQGRASFLRDAYLWSVGMEAKAPGVFTWGKNQFTFGSSFLPTVTDTGAKVGLAQGVGMGAIAGGSALWSAGTVYQGYQEEGLFGAGKALAFDAAVTGALFRSTHAWDPIKRTFIKSGFLARGAGALAGAGIAGGLGGALGSAVPFIGPATGWAGASAGYFVGAHIGSAPIKFAMKHPVALGAAAVAGMGTAALGGAAALGYGTYHVLKAGYIHRRMQERVDTSGDLSAFMTQSAFTMRQRAAHAFRRSQLNARSALGQEANFLHTQKNYFSRYRRY